MRVSIFTTGSKTVNEDISDDGVVEDYFQGLFSTVSSIAKELRENNDVDVHILTEELGYVTGSDQVGDARPSNTGASEKMQEALVDAAESSEVVILMLTNTTYERVVTPVWEELVNAPQKHKVWFVSASPSVLERLELNQLKGKVLTYQRIGVTRISNEAKKELFNTLGDC